MGFGKLLRNLFQGTPSPACGPKPTLSTARRFPFGGRRPGPPRLHRTVRGPGWRKRRLRSTLSPKGARVIKSHYLPPLPAGERVKESHYIHPLPKARGQHIKYLPLFPLGLSVSHIFC